MPALLVSGALTLTRGTHERADSSDPVQPRCAGCGCKISPQVLEVILAGSGAQNLDPKLWVGNASRDDAAVYALDDERAVLPTDFFMPIVDDPYDFGRIAATNAISDIYAMGGDPLMAIAILGWPVHLLPPEVAREVIRGGRAVCDEAGIPLAGGHSIDTPEPIFRAGGDRCGQQAPHEAQRHGRRRLPVVPSPSPWGSASLPLPRKGQAAH